MDETEQILQQIRMVLGTKPGQVLGSYEFGIDLSKFLFRMNFTEEQILYLVNLVIAQNVVYDTAKYQVYATVDYGHNIDDTSDYAVIDIVVNQKKCLGILVSQD